MSLPCQVRMSFYPPPPDLASYFTSFYVIDVDVAGDASVTDYLHPEWGGLRFLSIKTVSAEAYGGSVVSDTDFIATGPSIRTVRFSIGTTRLWGMGLLPLGWERFVGVPACDFADTVLDGHSHPALRRFSPLAGSLFGPVPDQARELATLIAFFRGLHCGPVVDEERILAMHEALVDPEVATVAALVARASASPRTVERVSCRAFGFPPKLLLRRQRFMRSLAQFMLDPSLKWIGAMDGHYHDQAQFVRDFRQFMGMTPRQYGALPHPVLDVAVRERSRRSGSAVQALDRPRARLATPPSQAPLAEA